MAPYRNELHGEWCKYDFEANKFLWQNRGFDKATPVRNRNLIDLALIFDEAGVHFWLQGRTLLGLHSYGYLLDDHDDDVGVWEQDRSIVVNRIHPKLIEMGFAMIRNNADIISFIRDDRYIDVCLFKDKGWKIGYANKWFPKKHFTSFDSINYLGKTFAVPGDAKELLRYMYEPSIFYRCSTILKRIVKPSSYITFYKRAMKKVANSLPHSFRVVFWPVLKTAGIEYKKVSEAEFLATLIEPDDSFNWRWRKPHLDLITCKGKYRRIGEIVQYLKSGEGLQKLTPQIKETDVSKPFYDPANMDQRFWQRGNNFFIYCIKYQFKHGVVPYGKANEYIKKKCRPLLYTLEYYESLRSMADEEIETLLKTEPIEITAGAITSGKHRVCAMIGRMVSGKPYIPFWAILSGC